jgi:NADH-ubiquinone oxidoreductase chain 6
LFKFIIIFIIACWFILAAVFLLTINPLLLSLLLVLISLLLGSTAWAIGAKWLGLSVILVFIGGIIVAFIYVSSLALNLKFTISSRRAFTACTLLVVLFSMLLVKMPATLPLMPLTLFSGPSRGVAIALILYLLLILLLVVKITECFKGSLIQKF